MEQNEHLPSSSDPPLYEPLNKRVGLTLGAVLVSVVLLVVVGQFFVTLSDSTRPEQKVPVLDAASASADRFFDGFVDHDGRVVRRESGGDTTGKVQAEGLLLAVATSDRARFDAMWRWAKTQLTDGNGLLVTRWQGGAIRESQVDVKANLDAARALSLAGELFADERYLSDGRAIAGAIKDRLVDGDAFPESWSPRAYSTLHKSTGDTGWLAIASQKRALALAMMGADVDDARLPAEPGGNSTADRSRRLVSQLAESCDTADRSMASRSWSILNRSRVTRTASVLKVDGSIADSRTSSLAATAAAAAAFAASDTDQMLQLLDVADQIAQATPTAEGMAGVALGRVTLTTTWLGGC